MSRKLASTAGTGQLVIEAQKELSETLSSEVAIFLPEGFESSIASGTGRLKPVVGRGSGFAAEEKEIAVAQWVYEHNQFAGEGTDTLPDAKAIYVPMTCPRGVVGVLGVRPEEQGRFAEPDQRQILEMAADLLALSIERDRLAEQAQQVLKLKAAL